MNVPRKTQANGPGWSRVRCTTTRGDGFAGLSGPLWPRHASLARPGPAIHWKEQRPSGGLYERPGGPWLDQQRHPDAGHQNVGGVGTCFSDPNGCQAKQSGMVCADVGGPGLVLGNGDPAGIIPSRAVRQKLPHATNSKNASLTPPHGAYGHAIAPPDGVRASLTTPCHGAMRAIFPGCLTPPHGDLSSWCHLPQSISRGSNHA